MAREIEKKFLVKGDFKRDATGSVKVTQGYLSSVPERTVRVRINGDKGFITVKGIGNETDISRFEWEREIAVEDARNLLAICEPGIIDQTRYHVSIGTLNYEIDEFYGDNEGLIIAEVELSDEQEEFEKPHGLAMKSAMR